MRISDLIEQLKEHEENLGDVEVALAIDDEWNRVYFIDSGDVLVVGPGREVEF